VEIINAVIARGEKVLVFSQWSSFLNILQEKLEDWQLKSVKLDGSVDMKKRHTLISQFKEDATCCCLMSTYKVGGVGLNLTCANNVVLADLWWNPSVEDQAVDRTHRLGQKNKVNVYKLVVQESVEQEIVKLQEKKKTDQRSNYRQQG